MNTQRNRVWAATVGLLVVMGMAGAQAVGASRAEVPIKAAAHVGALVGAQVGTQVASETPDQLIFKDGRIIKGKVLEETATQVRFLVVVAGISGEQTYNKSDILAIERGTPTTADAESSTTSSAKVLGEGDHPDHPDAAEEADESAPGVYVLELTGKFGRDIAPTPIRNAIKDAAKHRPDYLIVILDNAWENRWGQELSDDEGAAFDQLFQAEDIEPIFTKELPEILGYKPKIVFWVKNAMGGAAFLPLNFDTIYFSSDGRMGGIGNLTEMFGTTGDERVREKQFSLRMGHARGMAVRGGYDTKIVKAMARTDYVLSYRIEDGKVVLIERMPNTDLGEHLLTDDGAGENADTIQELARGQGNDTLTLNAEIASILGLSKGTVDDLDSLLYELDIDRHHRMIDGRSERIMTQWGRQLESAERGLRDLWKKYNETEVQGEYRERQAARARRMQLLMKIKGLLEKYDEVYKVRLLELPPGLPGISQIEVMIEQLRQEQMRDRP